MPYLNGGQALMNSLARMGADTVFGVPGAGQYEAVDALWRHASIRYVSVRHEQEAAFMADAYAQVAGHPAVVLVVPGPGLLYAGAGLVSAFANSTPLLAVTSVNSHPVLRARQLEQTVLDTTTKWTAQVETVAEIPAAVEEAWRQMSSGRPRPVGLVVPSSVLAASDDVTLPSAAPTAPRPVAQGLADIVAQVRQARRPLLWVGSGVLRAGAVKSFRRLAHALQIPVVTSRRGKSVMSETEPLGMGISEMRFPPLREWIAQRDLLIAIGTSQDLSRLRMPVIQIDVDDPDPERFPPDCRYLQGDALTTLEALHPLLVPRAMRPAADIAADLAAVQTIKARRFAPETRLQPQGAFMQAIRNAAPADTVFVQGMNQMGYYSRGYLNIPPEGQFLTSSSQITLGAAYPMSLGAKLARPDRPVVAITGDGGFLYGVHGLATAVQHRIHSVALVFNDHAYGNVLRAQREQFDERVIGTRLHNPDFAALARTFGARGYRAASADELAARLHDAVRTEAHTLIEIPVGEMQREY